MLFFVHVKENCLFGLLFWSVINLENDGFDSVEYFQCEAVDPADVDAIARTVEKALATYGTPALKEMIQNCMAQDFSWKVSSNIPIHDI